MVINILDQPVACISMSAFKMEAGGFVWIFLTTCQTQCITFQILASMQTWFRTSCISHTEVVLLSYISRYILQQLFFNHTRMVACCSGKKDTQVVELPIVDSLSPRPPYLPLAVPKDLASRLARLHGDPIVWWIGQILKFVLRPQEATSNMIQEASIKRGFKRPVVG